MVIFPLYTFHVEIHRPTSYKILYYTHARVYVVGCEGGCNNICNTMVVVMGVYTKRMVLISTRTVFIVMEIVCLSRFSSHRVYKIYMGNMYMPTQCAL